VFCFTLFAEGTVELLFYHNKKLGILFPFIQYLVAIYCILVKRSLPPLHKFSAARRGVKMT
jgi:hypothetical protein